jgi:hypothetical protein
MVQRTEKTRYGFDPVASGVFCVDEEDLAETTNKIGYPLSQTA